MEEVMSSGYSLVQETADSIDEVCVSQVPGPEKIFNQALPEEPMPFPSQGFCVCAGLEPGPEG